MNKSSKVPIVSLIIFLLSLLGFLFVNISNQENNSSDQKFPLGTSSDNRITLMGEDQRNLCLEKLNSNLFGVWLYQGGEDSFAVQPMINIRSDGTFLTNAWGGDGESVEGKWEFNRDKFIFNFSDTNNYWNSIDVNNLQQYSGLEFIKDGNVLTVPIGYSERSQDFTNNCKLDHFHIDMMNYYLHKVME